MKLLSRRDISSALVTGLTTGIIAWRILVYLDKMLPLGINPVLLVPLIPVLWLAGVQLGYFLAMYIPPFAQFGKFAAIGFANAMVDFGVLYLLIALTGKTGGYAYAVMKGSSFLVATLHSYVWNKTWTFDSGNRPTTTREVLMFLVVSVASLLVNVASAYATVALGPLGGLDAKAWAGIGAVVGSAVALIFNFLGLKLIVFRK